MIKKKSLLVALVSGFIVSSVLVLTLVGYYFYLELKDKESSDAYLVLLHKTNARAYSGNIEISRLDAAIENTGVLKGSPVLEGTITNRGYKEISDILIKVRFLDRDGAVLYETVFRPHEPPLGSSGLVTNIALPYLTGDRRAVIKPSGSLVFKKIITNCPAGILSELKKEARSGKGYASWSGKLDAEVVSITF